MGLDLRPRIVLYPPGGAVVILVDPTSALGGTVQFPLLGSVPYDMLPGFPVSTLMLHVPYYGDVPVPIDILSLGGNGPSSVDIPMLGAVPYEITLGPPRLPEGSLLTDTVSTMGMPLVLLGVAAVAVWWIVRR